MKRRVFLSTAATTTALIAGCTGDDAAENSPGDAATEANTDTDSPTDAPSDSETQATPEYDAVIDYTTHVQSEASGEYDLPEPTDESWSWIVVDFEVVDGELDMEDVWFDGLFETTERYLTVSKQSDTAENGIEPRGTLTEGAQGVILHEYPHSPASGLVGPMFSATDTSIGGEGVGRNGPTELYPPVTVEYSVRTAENPAVLSDEYDPERGNVWAVVNLSVTEGVLNLEDVWFRSQVVTDSRVYECDHISQFADRGVRSRGLVKQGNSANALYQIAENETVEEWRYQEGNRQEVTIQRA